MSDMVKGPETTQAPASYKGGPGKYDGANDQGWPTRSGYGEGATEKFYDEQPPLPTGQD